MEFEDVLLMILDELRLLKPGEYLFPRLAIRRLYHSAIRWFAKGGNMVIAIDEAQNFNRKTLESFRMISNLETNKHKLIQIVLAGQPELDQRLDTYGMKPFVQRINLKRYIKPLSEDDTYAYLDHRLNVINYSGPPLFDKRARQLIWAYSKGVPRIINNICDNALLIGYATEKRTITGHEVAETIKDLSYNQHNSDNEKPKKRKNIIPFRRAAMF
jgi:type II secretory pathway predicted ATPase ExeA